jgi:hypothetical protein
MTLIVGIKCCDGIVLGADGAATLSVLGMGTAKQQVKKLMMIQGSVIVGVSGSVGLAQRISGEIEVLWEGNKLSSTTVKKPFQAMTVIRSALWQHIEPEMRAAHAAAPVVGQPVASQSAICSTAVAVPVAHTPCLFSFDQQASPVESTVHLPFVAIGSGQPIADPFLAFLRRIFWPAGLPTLAEGIFAVLWTLTHAILTAPGGISEPVQIAVLEHSSGKWKARELPEEEQQEHREAIGFAESSLASFRESFKKTQGDAEAQEPPKP